MRTIAAIICICMAAVPAAAAPAEKGLTVRGVRYFSYPEFTRLVFETDAAAPYVLTRSGDGQTIYFSAYGGPFTLSVARLPLINDGVVKHLEPRQDRDQKAIIITLGPAAGEIRDFVLRGPDRVVVDVHRGPSPAPGRGPSGSRLPVVVLDPGHGGADPGAATEQGAEKTFTLDLANAVRRALRRGGSGLTVRLTREQDQALTADERAAFANNAEPALFVSLHGAPGAGLRVLILDPDEGQLQLPAGGGDFAGFDAVSDLQQMTWGSQQARHAQDSGRLGRSIVRSFPGREGSEAEQAPVLLLKAVDAAAVFVEVGTARSRTQAADAIARGVEQYVQEKR